METFPYYFPYQHHVLRIRNDQVEQIESFKRGTTPTVYASVGNYYLVMVAERTMRIFTMSDDRAFAMRTITRETPACVFLGLPRFVIGEVFHIMEAWS